MRNVGLLVNKNIETDKENSSKKSANPLRIKCYLKV